MSRAARRRLEREAKKKPTQTINLQNPVSHHFGSFIVGNALYCTGPEAMLQADSAQGRTVLIAGAGPSLNEHIAEYAGTTTELWGCNSALPWLLEQGYPVTHGITVDQTPAMLNEWETAPDVEYLLCSTVHPFLTEHLIEKHARRVKWFHNFVGIAKPPVEYCQCGHDKTPFHARGRCTECPECTDYRPYRMPYEEWLYAQMYPPGIRVGSGLNTATRAIDLALTMGYDRVVVLGADCSIRVKAPLPRHVAPGSAEHKAWLADTVMHANGGNALASGATATTIGGEIDGRWWETKPDLMISAVFLLRMQEAVGEDRLQLVGDTLPNALKAATVLRKNDGTMVRVRSIDDVVSWMPALMDSNGKPLIPKADPETVALWRAKSLG